jgi:hypothetical protein
MSRFRVVAAVTAVATCALSLLSPAALSGCTLNRSPLAAGERREGSAIASMGGGGALSTAGTGENLFGNGAAGTLGTAGTASTAGTAGTGADASMPSCNSKACPPQIKPGVLPNGSCEPTGVYGLQFSTDVVWGGRNTPLGYITDNGRGRITIHLRVTVPAVNADGTFTADVLPCNVELPAFFSTILCEVYQPIFPTTMWDSPTMRTLSMQGSYDCTSPGCTMKLMPNTALIGIDLTDPNIVWPADAQNQAIQCSAGSSQNCFLDHDDDKIPGITTTLLTTGATPSNSVCTSGYPFRNAPLTSDPLAIASGAAARAARLYLGTRVRFGGDGMIMPGCGQRTGKGVAYGFDSRATGCAVQASGQDCDISQKTFMDANLPLYQVLTEAQEPPVVLDLPDKSPSQGTLISISRLGDADESFTCSQIRAAPY